MHEPRRGSSVLPISARDLLIERGGRQLLCVPQISLGHCNCTMVVGPNGAGKSLLLRTLCGLQQADSGTVSWNGSPPDRSRRHRVGLLLQRPVLLRRSALQNVIFALRLTGPDRHQASQQATAVLQQAGLAAVANTAAHRLSGGEQQRLALARALALRPDMLFMDEATANVDPASTLVIEQQLCNAMQAGLKVVMISHDTGQARRLANDVLLMHNGHVVEHSDRQAFFERTNNPVTRRWLAGELLV